MPALIACAILSCVVTLVVALVVTYVILRKRDRAHAVETASRRAAVEGEHAERERLADLLRVETERYRILFNNTKDMVFIHGITPDGLPGRFIDVNDIACEKTGYSRDELLELTPSDISAVPEPVAMLGYSKSDMIVLSDDDIAEKTRKYIDREAQLQMNRILENKHVIYNGEYITRSGKPLPVEIIAQTIELEGRPLIMCTAHDIIDRQRMQRALRESEQRFQDFFAHSPIGVAYYDGQKRLVNVNQACLKMFGIPDSREFAKFNMFDNPFIPPHVSDRLNKGETVRFETNIDFKDVLRFSLFITGRTGQAHLDILIQNLGLDPEYKPKGYLVQVQDNTQQYRAEEALRQSEKQLRQAEKMEAIGSLAGGIAHDFNNILTPILGYAEIIMRTCPKNDPLYQYMQEIHKASNRAKELVNQILTFSRKTDKEGHPIHVIPIVKEVLVLVRAALPENIEINRIIKTEEDVVLGDPTQMHQVLMNLCTNAGHAMKGKGGTLEVWVTSFVIMGRSSEFPSLQPGRYIRISVKDTGTGIDKSVLGRIFEPFFTTKERGEGTGMGLAVVHGIVSALKGVITVETEVGKGSVFHVVLPLIEKKEEEMLEKEEPLPTGNECVLFVDDEPEIVRMASEMLSALGYTPVAVYNAKDALKMFEENPGQFDLIITDQVMPGMRGLELVRKIRSLCPEIPIILCTGFSETFAQQQAEALGISGLLMKPIVMRNLAEMIRAALSQRPKKE
jgi:PAS domain S-box-containing protein